MDTVNAGDGVRLRDDNFAFYWEGRIYIPVAANYTFETSSDDGSRLYIDVPYTSTATPVVDNDGGHGLLTKTGTKYLTQGYHNIVITYFDATGGNEISLYWSNSSGLARERIPKNFFAIEDYPAGPAVNAPSSVKATAVAYNKISLAWTDNSSNESAFEIVRSTSPSGTFVPVFTTAANETSYNDSALSPATTYYYKVRAVGPGGESAFTGSYPEANYKFNNDYTDAMGGSTLVNSSTGFISNDQAEGSQSVEFTNSDYINFGGSASAFPSLGGYNQRTVALWIKPASTTSRRMLVDIGGSDNGLGIRFNGDALIGGVASGSVRSAITLNSFASNSNWLANQWNHVALVYNINTLTLYLNGVQVAQNLNLTFASIGNSSNQSRLGMPSSTSASASVFNDQTYSTYLGKMDNLYIIRGALTAADIITLKSTHRVNFAQATTFAAPAPPAVPTGLTANVLSTNAIYLAWNDVADSETGYEIWRSSGDKTNDRAIAKIGAGNGSQMNFTDTTLFANVTYYYKVRALGVIAPSAFSAEVSGKTPNTKPAIKKVINFTMKYGTTFTLPVTATDPDGDALTFSTINLPVFAVEQQVSNGSMNIVFSPGITRRGSYSISITVDDANGGQDTTSFTLVVNTNEVPVINEVSDIMIAEGVNANLALTGSDDSGTANLIWSFEGLPSFATFTNNNDGTGNISFKTGYASAGVYPITIILNDGFGAWSSRSLVLTVTDKDPEETLQFNFRLTSAAVPLWNSVNIASPTFSHGTILDTKSNVSTVALVHVKGNVNGSTQGPQTGNNSGPFPDLVMKDIMVWGYNLGTNAFDTVVMKVTGLDVSKKYDFVFYSGYNLNGIATSISRFVIGTDTATINYYQNTSKTDTIENAVPNASGEITITCIGDPVTSRGAALNAMVIKAKFDDGSVPAKPTNLTGAHVQNGAVKLKWDDRAFNEKGYMVYRSLSRSGAYDLLNPGATNRDSTSYDDGTIAPETTYYYYVAGFNNSGPGISSDTIQVVTGNNKPIIAAPADIYLKTDAAVNIDFPVTDDTGDVVTVSLEGNPSFIKMQSLGGTNYRFAATTATDNIGWYKMTVKAIDQKGAVALKVINVSVTDKST
jgi:hypothetical protein